MTSAMERVYTQLRWVESRRARIIASVGAHFSQAKVDKVLESDGLTPSILGSAADLQTLLDDRPPAELLRSLAYEVEKREAATLASLRSHISVYRQHVDEQILFGSRTAGQEAGRDFLLRTLGLPTTSMKLSLPEAVQAVFELTYSGLPDEKNHFLCLRLLGGSTVHFMRSPHLAAWRAAGADPAFLFAVKTEWIRGILDVLAPGAHFTTSQAIEEGAAFGLSHFHIRDQHAQP